jgi:SNF2 family DNA or RNA helicase
MWYEKLLPEQAYAYQFLSSRLADYGGAGLFSEQGTGKTIVTMALLERLELSRLLIICPLTAVETTWVPRLETLGLPVCRTWEEYKTRGGILVIHFELLTKEVTKLAKHNWDIVVIDESQKIKERGSGWSRAARRLRNATRRLALSGTPVDKSPIDVWGQMRFIDPDVLGENWNEFGSRFCYKGGYMGKRWIFDYKKMDEFLDTVKPCVYRLSAAFLKLPPMTVNLVPVDLLGHQREVYDSMTQHSLAKVNDEWIKADLAITRLAKQEQIVNGFIINEDEELTVIGHAKERKLKWLLGQLERPVVICCKYLHDLDVAQDIVGSERVAVLKGATKKERTKQVEAFQAGRLDVLCVQIRTGGVSIEFTRSHNLIVYSMNHSFIDFDQFLKRLQRYGQTKTVNVYIIYASDTVDEEKIEVIKTKSNEAGYIVSHFERN